MGTAEMTSSTPPDRVGQETFNRKLLACAHPRRRTVLEVLFETSDGTIEFERLVEHVTAQISSDTNTYDERRRRIRIELYHWHLPKLDACDLLEFHHESGNVQLVDDLEVRDVLTVLEQCDAGE